MTDLIELKEIREKICGFKELGIGLLAREEASLAQKIDEISIESKLKMIELIDEEIEELEEQLNAESDENELLDIELIRLKTQTKKAEKHLKKLESLNSNQLKVDATDRDKIRLSKTDVNLKLIKRLLDLNIEDGKVVLSGGDGSFSVLETNKNKESKEENAQKLREKMKESSPYIDEWKALFGIQDQ